MKCKAGVVSVLLLMLILSITSCATMNTVEGAKPNIPKFFSGTRLDICALRKKSTCAAHFSADPPKYPVLDLPGSFLIDSLISPITAWEWIGPL